MDILICLGGDWVSKPGWWMTGESGWWKDWSVWVLEGLVSQDGGRISESV